MSQPSNSAPRDLEIDHLLSSLDAEPPEESLPKNTEESSNIEKRFVCKKCGSAFARKYDFKRHILSKHSDGMIPKLACDVCRKTFKRMDGLKRHQNGRCRGLSLVELLNL
ncbi:hypothetical protein BDR26DRAFT_849180 [Obelidium mucronatum]|nr:hypothetical protein BDR26DRAFT_849180 [Obelidium mucronatum]